MTTINFNTDLSLAGKDFNYRQAITGAAETGTEITNAGSTLTLGPTSGTLSTRTDNDTGVVTAAGHGLSTSDKVTVFWTGGVRYGMTATVSGDDVTVDGGAGDNLPAEDDAVSICKQTEIDANWPDVDGDAIEAILAQMDIRGHVEFQEADGTTITGWELTARQASRWASADGSSNPFTGVDIGKLQVSAGEALTSESYFRCAALL